MSNTPPASQSVLALFGIESNVTSHGEKAIATLGSLLGILTVVLVSRSLAGGSASLLVTSMGASAVLLFVVPHGALSQPWPVIGGHMVSALIGVACAQWFAGELWTPALAVALSIASMQYLRCVHPPGGATALMAVTGGEQIHALGYGFLLDPVLVNVVSILLLAIVFNNLFPWRRYPAVLMKREHTKAHLADQAATATELTQEDFEAAMHKLNTFVDVSSEELVELVELAYRHAEEQRPHPATIEPGHCYSNGRLGRHWSVRQVIDIGSGRHKTRIIYKTMAGAGAWDTGICGYEEFRQWARFEVESKDGRWVRVGDSTKPVPAGS